jgi:hypothetical protein
VCGICDVGKRRVLNRYKGAREEKIKLVAIKLA